MSSRTPYLISLLAVVLAAPPSPVTGQRSAVSTLSAGQHAAVTRFAQQLREDVRRDGVGSITAGVVDGAELVWTESFGHADRENGVEADSTHLYRVGSISKTVTAVLMMQLVERGVIRLDDRVSRYFPAVEQLGDEGGSWPVTFRQLASHTAGLIREPRLPDAAAGPIEGWEEKVVESIGATAFENRPGVRYSYSNIGFGILGLALSRAAGRPFMDLVHESIFEPLGMRESYFIVPPDRLDRLAVGYANGRDGEVNRDLPAREHAGRGYKVPNGGVYTTVGDLARFVAGLSGAAPHPIMSDGSRLELQSVQTPEDPDAGYGLGVAVRRSAGGTRLVGHGGSVAGYNAYMVFDPDTRMGVVMLRNFNRGATNLGRAASQLLTELVEGGSAR